MVKPAASARKGSKKGQDFWNREDFREASEDSDFCGEEDSVGESQDTDFSDQSQASEQPAEVSERPVAKKRTADSLS